MRASEWYFNKNSIVSLGLFQKNISTYIQSLRVNMPYSQTGLPRSLLPANFTGEEVFQVTTPVNTGDGGKLTGFELNYQQPLELPAGSLEASRRTGELHPRCVHASPIWCRHGQRDDHRRPAEPVAEVV